MLLICKKKAYGVVKSSNFFAKCNKDTSFLLNKYKNSFIKIIILERRKMRMDDLCSIKNNYYIDVYNHKIVIQNLSEILIKVENNAFILNS